jgi:hypothetical protein
MTPISQRDPKWTNIKLGTSNVTIGTHGCVVTGLAILANTTPDVVNERFLAVDGYSLGNLVIWDKVKEALPDMYCAKTGWKYDNADVLKNLPCLVEVDGAPIGASRHWVVYIGNQKMLDPWTGKEESTSKYVPLSYRIIKGEFKMDIVLNWKENFKFDVTKRLADEIFNGLNLHKAVGLPRETALDSIHRAWNKLNDTLVKTLGKANENEGLYKTEVSKHEETRKKLTEEIENLTNLNEHLEVEIFETLTKELEDTKGTLKISNKKIERLLAQDFTFLESLNFMLKSLKKYDTKNDPNN